MKNPDSFGHKVFVAAKVTFVVIIISFAVIYGKERNVTTIPIEKNQKREQRDEKTWIDSMQCFRWEEIISPGDCGGPERYFASLPEAEIADGPITIRWVTAIDSVPLEYPLTLGETGQPIAAETHYNVPTICGTKDGSYFLAYVFGQQVYYKNAWLTKDFWRTKHWDECLKTDCMTDGPNLLWEALKLSVVDDLSAATLEFGNCQHRIESELPFAIALDTLSGDQMKKVLVLFTETMHEKNTN